MTTYISFQPEIRTMTIHETIGGWLFSICRNKEVIYRSPIGKDRAKVVEEGMQYLNNLRELEDAIREQQKGSNNGH